MYKFCMVNVRIFLQATVDQLKQKLHTYVVYSDYIKQCSKIARITVKPKGCIPGKETF